MQKSTRTVSQIRWYDPVLVFLFLLFAIGYYLVSEPAPFSFTPDQHRYQMLAEAFLAGQTSFLFSPPEDLLNLPDPFDPSANGPYRQHDMSLYKGKWFMYFGPTPALVLYAPWFFLTGIAAPDRFGVAVFSIAALWFAFQALRILFSWLFPDTSARRFYWFCVILGFSSVLPFLLKRPKFYEVAISSGQCFLMAAVAAITLLLRDAKTTRLWIGMAAGASLGLAVGCRPNLLLFSPLLLLLLRYPVELSRDRRLQRFIAATSVLVVCGAALLVYNYVRFDSPFEFGASYQLTATNRTNSHMFSVGRVPVAAYLYLAGPLSLVGDLPYIEVDPDPPFVPSSILRERCAGLVWILPFVAPLVAFRKLRNIPSGKRAAFNDWVLTSVAACLTILILDSSVGISMRYAADWSLTLSIACFLVWSRIGTGIVPLGIWTIWVNAAIAYQGY